MCEILKEQYEKAFNKSHCDQEIKIDQVLDDEKEVHIYEFFSGESVFTEIDITTTDVCLVQ